jgi:hypothetical protein
MIEEGVNVKRANKRATFFDSRRITHYELVHPKQSTRSLSRVLQCSWQHIY